MPLSYFRRPSCLILISYMLALGLLHSWGAFEIAPSGDWSRFLWRKGILISGTVLSGGNSKKAGDRIRLRMDRVDGRPVPEPMEAYAFFPRSDPENERLRPGMQIECRGRLRRPLWPRNPGEFDERGFCSDRGVGFIFQGEGFRILSDSRSFGWLPWIWAEAVHRSIHGMLARSLPATEASIWEGLLLGYKGPMDSSTQRDIQDAGVMHLLVPSGAKMAFVLSICLWACTKFGLGPMARGLAAAVLGGFYALMVGAEPPYLRAYEGALIGYMARPYGRDLLGFQAVVLSAGLILAFNPRELFSAGFQMTYAAILGIMLAAPRWKPPSRWPGGLKAMVRLSLISFVVQLMLWPILAEIFGRVSMAGLIANIVLVPISGIYMAIGFSVWAIHGMFPVLVNDCCVPILRKLALMFSGVCFLFARLPGASWSVGPMGAGGALAFYMGAIGILVLPRWGAAMKAWAAAALFLIASHSIHKAQRSPVWIILIEKSGRGAVLARFPDGQRWILSGSLGASEILPFLNALGIRRLDGAILRADKPLKRQMETVRRLPVKTVRVLRQEFFMDRGGALLRATPLSVRYGNVTIRFGRAKAVVGDGHAQFCILFPDDGGPGFDPPVKMPYCGLDRTASTRRDGAVRIQFNEEKYSVDSQRELYPLGHSFL